MKTTLYEALILLAVLIVGTVLCAMVFALMAGKWTLLFADFGCVSGWQAVTMPANLARSRQAVCRTAGNHRWTIGPRVRVPSHPPFESGGVESRHARDAAENGQASLGGKGAFLSGSKKETTASRSSDRPALNLFLHQRSQHQASKAGVVFPASPLYGPKIPLSGAGPGVCELRTGADKGDARNFTVRGSHTQSLESSACRLAGAR